MVGKMKFGGVILFIWVFSNQQRLGSYMQVMPVSTQTITNLKSPVIVFILNRVNL